MWTVKCDTPGCGWTFHPPSDTVNDILVIRDLARASGWNGPMDRFPPSSQRAPDMCPACTERATPKPKE